MSVNGCCFMVGSQKVRKSCVSAALRPSTRRLDDRNDSNSACTRTKQQHTNTDITEGTHAHSIMGSPSEVQPPTS